MQAATVGIVAQIGPIVEELVEEIACTYLGMLART